MSHSSNTFKRFVKAVEQMQLHMPGADVIMMHPKTAHELGLDPTMPFVHNGYYYRIKASAFMSPETIGGFDPTTIEPL